MLIVFQFCMNGQSNDTLSRLASSIIQMSVIREVTILITYTHSFSVDGKYVGQYMAQGEMFSSYIQELSCCSEAISRC